MRMQRVLFFAVLALCLGLIGSTLSRTNAKPHAAPFDVVERTTAGAARSAALPLVIAIHGLGDTPEDFAGLYDGFEVPVRIVAPRAPDPWPVGSSWYPVDDAKQKPAVIGARADLIAKLIADLRAKQPTRGRAIVTGFSQGGVLSFAVAALHPESISAALPIAGALPEGMPPPRRVSSPPRVFAFHGTSDARVRYADAQRTVRSLEAAGTPATLTSFEGLGHHISPMLRATYFAALREAIELATSPVAPQVGLTQ